MCRGLGLGVWEKKQNKTGAELLGWAIGLLVLNRF